MRSSRLLLPVILMAVLPGWALAQAPAPPTNLRVEDRLADDGDALNVKFDRSPDDPEGGGAVASYRVYRQVGAGTPVLAATVPATGAPTYYPVVTGLQAGVTYTIRVEAFDGVTSSTQITGSGAPVDNTIPRPPGAAAVTDVASDQGLALRLQFNASPDDIASDREVTQYVIERIRWGRATGDLLAPVTATAAATYAVTDASLEPGVKYGYRIKSVAATGASTWTTLVWETTVDNLAPRPPSWLSLVNLARSDGDMLYVTFGRSGDDGALARDVVKYTVYHSLNGTDYTLRTTVMASGASSYTYMASGLQKGVTHWFAVTAWDKFTESTRVVNSTIPLDTTPPAQPSGLTVADIPNDQGGALRIQFNASTDDTLANPEVTHYLIQRMRLGRGTIEWLPAIPATRAATYACTDSGLVPGVTYGYRVKSVSATRESPLTYPVVWGTATDNKPPLAPAWVTVSEESRGDGDRLRVTFGRSGDDGGGGRDVVRYTIYHSLNNTTYSRIAVIPATGASTYEYWALHLTRNVVHYFAVTAMDGTYESGRTIGSATSTDRTPPGMPSVVAVNDVPGDNGRALQVAFNGSWDDRPGDREVTHYMIERTLYGRSTGEWLPQVNATGQSRYQYTDTGLTAGAKYGYRVKAVAPTGESALTTIVWGTTVDNRPPGPPASLNVTDPAADNGDTAQLSFGRSADDGSGADDVIRYNIYHRLANGTYVSKGQVTATDADSYSFLVTGLTKGVTNWLAVTAWDGTYESTRVERTLVPLDSSAPRPASGLTVTDWPDDDGMSLKVAFTASADDSTSNPEVTRYDIYRAESATATGSKVAEVAANRAAAYETRNGGLTAGRTYWYWVIAVAPTGSAAATAKASGTPADNRPVLPPTGLTAQDRPYDNGGIIDLAWGRSGDDGAGRNHVANYRVYRKMANVVQESTLVGTVTATDAVNYQWSDTTVPMELILYEYTVVAVSSGGAVSTAAGPARAAAENNNVLVFQPPTGLTVVDVTGDAGGQLRLTWTRSTSEDDIGPPPPPPVTFSAGEVSPQGTLGGQYEFYRRTSSGTYGSTPTFVVSDAGTTNPMTYVDTGLSNGTMYTYKVRYRRYNQVSAFTAEASATPVVGPAAAAAPAAVDPVTQPEDEEPATLTVSLSNPPQTVLVGQDLTLTADVNGPGAGSVCLEYSINGAAVARTAAVSGQGSYQATIRIKTSVLSPRSVIRVRAVAVSGALSAASDVATVMTASP